MRPETYRSILDQLSPALVEEAAIIRPHKRRSYWPLMTAACFFLLLCAIPLWKQQAAQLSKATEFQNFHYSNANEHYAVLGSLEKRYALSEFSSALHEALSKTQEDFISTYHSSLNELSDFLGIPLLMRTSHTGTSLYYETDDGTYAPYNLILSKNGDGNLACISLHSVRQFYYQTEAGNDISLTTGETQEIFTEHYAYDDLLTCDLQDGETVAAARTYLTADQTPVCIVQVKKSPPERDTVSKEYRMFFQKNGVVVNLTLYLDPYTAVSDSEIETLLYELLDSYTFTEGGGT